MAKGQDQIPKFVFIQHCLLLFDFLLRLMSKVKVKIKGQTSRSKVIVVQFSFAPPKCNNNC